MGSVAARRGEKTPLSLRDIAPFVKPPLKGEVGSVAARRGKKTLLSFHDIAFSGETTPLSLRDISPFRGDKLEHSVTLPLL